MACGSDPEGPAGDTGGITVSAAALAQEDPAGWSCQRYGDVTDEDSDSYDRIAALEAERYLVEEVQNALGERGVLSEDVDELAPRWTGLLSEICVEWPDLVLEAAAGRVAEGLP